MRARPRPEAQAFGEAWERLFEPAIAHRGLWTPGGSPENSLAAFQAACAGGYAIELDVQLTADNHVVVFHDDHLERLTGAVGKLRDHTAADLERLTLSGTDETIPSLADALTVIGHRAMVYIELKTPFGEVGELEKRVSDILLDHNGPTAVIGFNPYSHAWFAEHQPQILRGLDSYGWADESARRLAPEMRKSLAALEHVEIARPDFLALGMDMLPSPRADLLRAKGMPIIAWTVRSAEQWDSVSDHCDNMIFEGFAA
ncbi:glycerophosphodiester phosphodiesterase [Caulobacter sp. DWR3-1-2]|uniref:glycerophosphodiester phosphodiesterase n=1 Tax=Caulobacter sp. DWR3-1-2 TaxID=2804647 RepID=UPI0019AF0BC1|nr:glycerophosphodiester phosphodiesterase [Caulobacter sp.]